MTKQELEKAIENEESVWYITGKDVRGLKITKKDLQRITKFDEVYKTKAEAEHYLYHANITRTETLPFLTWEEFLKETRLNFIACDGVSNMTLYYCDNTIYLVDDEYPEFNTTSWELTEENFYNAYDECVRLFRGEK